ncbi:hypothetical protein KGY79_06630 [Candidatus Bipolaricaulota bacterium]|nr:hypothetical protein [Candidatus Bipolaricaulota bacterium]
MFKEIEKTLQKEITKNACFDDICQKNHQREEFHRENKQDNGSFLCKIGLCKR